LVVVSSLSGTGDNGTVGAPVGACDPDGDGVVVTVSVPLLPLALQNLHL
jgi:hypothetical protein